METSNAKVLSYQLECLKAEIDYLTSIKNDLSSSFVRKHLQQFRWTVRRMLGLEVEPIGMMEAWRTQAPLPASFQSGASLDVEGPFKTGTRLLIDATATATYQGRSGIERAVRELSLRALQADIGMPVVFHKDGLYPAHETFSESRRIKISSNDCLIMLDASWNVTDQFIPVFETMAAANAKVVMCLFDIIPILYPATCAAGTVSRFCKWFEIVIRYSSSILCNSRATAVEIKALIAERGYAPEENIPSGWFPL